MSQNHYFLSRVPVFTPITANYLFAEDTYTLLSPDALAAKIADRGGRGPEDFEHLKSADNNHGIYWRLAHIHKISNALTFLNFDLDRKSALEEFLYASENNRDALIRFFVWDFLESTSEDRIYKIVKAKAPGDLLHHLNKLPKNKEPFDGQIFDEQEKAIFQNIFSYDRYDYAITAICAAYSSEKQQRFETTIKHGFEHLHNYNGWTLNGQTQLYASEAIRNATYIGNAENVLHHHLSGKNIETTSNFLGRLKDAFGLSAFAKHIIPGQYSDLLTNCRFKDLRPKRHSPLEGLSQLERRIRNYDEHWIITPPSEELNNLVQEYYRRQRENSLPTQQRSP